MKILEKDNRMSLIDTYNVIVEFDYEQYSGESCGYFFSNNIPVIEEYENLEELENNQNQANILINLPKDLNTFIFDTSFFLRENTHVKSNRKSNRKSHACFKLTNKTNKEIYLSLYNIHNSTNKRLWPHIFKMTHNNEIIREGEL